jgi:membrane protein DedA with SNARE-associated domain
MPFAGFLAETGRFNIWLVILFSGLGSIIGSLISYWIGRYGGNALVVRFGKYLFLDAADLKWAEDWFAKSGDKTIFISRFIPAVRHVISVPAGIGKMNVWKFSLYTFVGATIWNGILAYAGFYLGQRWDLVEKYVGIVSHAAAVLLVLALLYVVIRHIRHHRKSKALEEEMEEQDVS